MTLEEAGWVYILSYCGAIGLILIGIIAMVMYHHLIRILFGLILLEGGVNLFLITLAFRKDSTAPIYHGTGSRLMSLPVPHALTLTSIVIGVAVIALMLTLVIHIYKHYGTLDARKIGIKGDEE